MLLAPVVRRQKGEFRDVIERLAPRGLRPRPRGRRFGGTGRPTQRVKLDKKKFHTIEAVVDRLVMDDKIRVRLSDSVETALRWGEGRVHLASADASPSEQAGRTVESENRLHSNRIAARPRARAMIRRRPSIFPSIPRRARVRCATGWARKWCLTSPGGARPGKIAGEGAILPWRRGGKRMSIYYKAMLRGVAAHFG